MRYSIQLFWSVPSSAYKKCCKDLVKRFPSIMLSCPVICENDPTLRRGFLNPFLSSQDAILSSFRSVLTLLKGYSKHGVSPISHSSVSSVSPVSPVSPSTFEYPIPSDLLRIFHSFSHFIQDELPSYHLDNRSLSIFSESSPRPPRSVDSQTHLLRPSLYPPKPDRKPLPRATTHEILPLVIVMWDRADDAETEPCPPARALPSRSSASQLRELLKESMGSAEEKKRRFAKQRAEGARRNGENPRFVSILVVHFLRNHVPTLIRRLNICADGIFVPRVGVSRGK